MSRISSQGTRLYVETEAAQVAATIASATKAKPATFTFSALPDELTEGRVVRVAGTGWRSVDGKAFQISDITSNTITLADSDTSDEVPAVTLGSITPVELEEFCMATLTLSSPAGTDIDVTTMCETERETVGGLGAISTWNATGFWDGDDTVQTRLRELKRSLDNVVFAAQFRDSTGLVWVGNVNTLDIRAGVDTAVAITVGGTLSGGVYAFGADVPLDIES